MKKIIIFVLKFYKKLVSTLLFSLLGHGCRYSPTCAEYSIEAMEKFGVTKGTMISMKRIIRCHPFSRHPAFDPVPDKSLK